MSPFYSIPIQKIVKETSNAVSITFEVPEDLKATFSFEAGQYVTIKSTVDGKELRRAYSICSSPKSGVLKIAVKAIENGTFSVYANTRLKAGDMVEVTWPEGRFILNSEANSDYIAFAAGSGITPIMSMIKEVLENDNGATFTLVYGNKTAADTIFKGSLDHLHGEFSNRFNLHYVYSREHIANSKHGRIDDRIVMYYIKNIYKETSFKRAFLCGPGEMIHTVSEALKTCGFDEHMILSEWFSASLEKENNDQIKEGLTEITVLLDDDETSFTMNQADTILAASLRKGIDPPYSCEGGICSSCIAKVTEGKAIMDKNTVLTDREVKEGFILTCQAHPTTSKIKVDFDDI
ncbi:MAG: 2Fe-2S iron-sulfur cluster binding domain-containing protein [Flavobacteriaceae bacterium]|nr:MAG: 2Fe-2S iron-sulfur cluster binding domain-containing protein [Flavobacteriaceae bacterium]